MKGCASLTPDSGYKVRCRYRLGKRISLPSPEVKCIRFTLIARRSAQRRGEVMDLGVSAWRVITVLSHEPVQDSPGGAAGEGTGQASRPITTRDRVAVRRRRAGLRAEQKGCSELRCTRSGGQNSGHRRAGHDAARCYER